MIPPELSDKPFLKIIIPAVLGIIMAWNVTAPLIVTFSCFMLTFSSSIFFRKNLSGQLYLWLTLLVFFYGLASLRMSKSEMPENEKITVMAQICESPMVRGRWQFTTADVRYYKPVASYREFIQEGMEELYNSEGWMEVNERIILAVDSSYQDIIPGLQIAFTGWMNPIDTLESSYKQLMNLRGIHGRMFITPGNLLRRAPHISKTPVYYSSKLQSSAVDKLQRLNLTSDAKSVVTAMTAGDKRAIERSLRSSYSNTGAAHLLAVSGLHVGIVFVLINILFYFLPLAGRGHIIKNIAAISAIWIYACMAGLAPSVIRAALMFSFAQVALATTSYKSSLNIICGSAVVMLALNPNWVADPSFLLSFAAVVSIIIFYNPVFKIVRTKSKLLNAILSVIIVGFVATLGTAPLVSYWFGKISIIGILINPIVIITAHIIVMLGVLWIIMPFEFWEPLFTAMLELAASIQNSVVSWSSVYSWGVLDVKLPFWAVCLIYSLYILIAVDWNGKSDKNEKVLSLPS